MKSRLLATIVCCFSLATGLSAATDRETQQPSLDKDAPRAELGRAESKPAGKKKVLAKGMTAAEVIAMWGKPAEVKPIKAPTGTAETWIYRRVAKRGTTMIATGSHEVPVYSLGAAGNEGTMTELDYSTVNITHYQITAVLMFNGQVQYAKQWIEQSNDFTSGN